LTLLELAGPDARQRSAARISDAYLSFRTALARTGEGSPWCAAAPHQTAAPKAGKQRLDIASRQPARIHLHRWRFQFGGAPAHDLANRRTER